MKIIQRDYAVAIPIDPKNNVLLQRKDSGYRFWPNFWCTFGGGLKEGETPVNTLIREMREENGLTLSDIALFESQSFCDETKYGEPTRRQGIVHYFSARFDGDLKKIKFGEGAGFSIFDKPELYRYNELGLIVPYNFEVIDRFISSINV